MFSNKSQVSIEALGFGGLLVVYTVGSGSIWDLSHVPSHLACMYFCFLHGAKCIFFSFMHFFAAEHMILTDPRNLSAFPTNTSGNRLTNWLYSSLARAISNSARKFNSITVFTTPLLAFGELSVTSK